MFFCETKKFGTLSLTLVKNMGKASTKFKIKQTILRKITGHPTSYFVSSTFV